MNKCVFFTLFLIFSLLFPEVRSEIYNVGPTQSMKTISEAMNVLQDGDTVYIHYGEYHELFVIGYDNVKIIGVPDSQGRLPVIDGDGATKPSSQDYTNEERGVIKIGTANKPSSTCPQNVLIENLNPKHARPGYYFTGRNGNTQFNSNAAGVYVECGKDITIKNNQIENNGNGIFIGSFSGETQNILITGNYVFDNGIEGSYYEHNLYCSATNIVYEFNEFGKLRTGCDGNNLKDRSEGVIIRYNYIHDGNRQLDLVENSAFAGNPLNLNTYVYGNILAEFSNDGNRQMVHYGGDSGNQDNYRKGDLWFHYNTVYSSRTGRSTMFMTYADHTIHATNNILYITESGDNFELLANKRGTLILTNNYLKGTFEAVTPNGGGEITYSQNIDDIDDPMFINPTNFNFGLLNSSVCKNAAIQLDSSLQNYQPTYQYSSSDNQGVDRLNAKDMGAFAFSPESNDPFIYYPDPAVIAIAIIVPISLVFSIIVFAIVLLLIVLLGFGLLDKNKTETPKAKKQNSKKKKKKKQQKNNSKK